MFSYDINVFSYLRMCSLRYAGQDGEIGEADAVKLVKDIMTLNKQVLMCVYSRTSM